MQKVLCVLACSVEGIRNLWSFSGYIVLWLKDLDLLSNNSEHLWTKHVQHCRIACICQMDSFERLMFFLQTLSIVYSLGSSALLMKVLVPKGIEFIAIQAYSSLGYNFKKFFMGELVPFFCLFICMNSSTSVVITQSRLCCLAV